ncbi:hypothetical protein NL676_025570 [Syzygium grande]|nr:hypothetical protein NL676_025570 [Syzygium grande]
MVAQLGNPKVSPSRDDQRCVERGLFDEDSPMKTPGLWRELLSWLEITVGGCKRRNSGGTAATVGVGAAASVRAALAGRSSDSSDDDGAIQSSKSSSFSVGAKTMTAIKDQNSTDMDWLNC